MIISEDRASYLAHIIIDGIWDDDLVDYTDEDMAMKIGKRALVKFVKETEDIHHSVEAKIQSLKRNVHEGTPEWDVMYNKYYEEEMIKRGIK